MKTRRLPLPKRFNVAMTEAAYRRLRKLNGEWHFGNNYLLTILLEHFDDVIDPDAWNAVMADFIAEFGQPESGGMR